MALVESDESVELDMHFSLAQDLTPLKVDLLRSMPDAVSVHDG
jgi:hypothetical protein